MIKYLVERIMVSSLKSAYRRICWVGPVPSFDDDRPIVLYANHTTFHDGYVLWLVSKKLFNREVHLWMEDWDNFPLFAAVGAQPFPRDDGAERLRTIRRTNTFLRENPRSTLIYLPEGELHAPEEGILPFPESVMPKLARIFPESQWLPVGIHLTSRGEAQPTLLLTGGEPHEVADGRERERLEACIHQLKGAARPCDRILLGGKQSPDESWNMRFLAPFFRRYL